jgi:membrane-bound lytic murein transglycosylase B
MGKNSAIAAGSASDGRVVIIGLLTVWFFIMTAGCQSSPPDEDAENTASRLKRLETRIAAIELNSDVGNERNKKFERFMAESERRQSELLLSMSKLQEQLQGKTPPPETVSSESTEGVAPSPVSETKADKPVKGAAAEQPRYHQVQKSDTIYSISRQYNLEPAAFRKMNDLKSDVIVPGQKLRVK